MKNIYTGTDDFKKIIENDCYYVDKTKIIEELLTNTSEAILFPRPRRFGKTLTMSMLYYFFECTIDSKDLFKGLYIESSKYYSEINKYPVIYLSFKLLKKDKYEDVYDAFKLLMSKLYVSKRYIYSDLEESEKEYYDKIERGLATKSEFEDALSRLEDFLCKVHKQKVIVLIDEYNMPIQTGYLNGYYKDVVNLIRNTFDGALKTNSSLKFGVLTGVLRVSKESILSGPNNVDVYGLMDDEFKDDFGFTESEVNQLLNYYDMGLTDEIKNMYDGYNFGGIHIYNPWSILNYTKRKKLDNYWINTSGNEIIKAMLNDTKEENKVVIEKLIQGESTTFKYDDKLTYKDFDNHNNLNIILNLLFSSGYLTFDRMEEDPDFGKQTYIKIPNKEVNELLVKIMTENVYGSETSSNLDNITNAVRNNDKKLLENTLNGMLMSTSFMDNTSESGYHNFMLGIFTLFLNNKNYIVKSNRESGNGRFDVMIERADREYGYIFEFKIARDNEDMESVAKNALDQIETKEYYKELELEKVKDIRKVSIVFSKKTCIVR